MIDLKNKRARKGIAWTTARTLRCGSFWLSRRPCTQACFDFHTLGKKQQLLSAQSNYKSKHKVQGTKPNDLFVKFLSLANVIHVDVLKVFFYDLPSKTNLPGLICRSTLGRILPARQIPKLFLVGERQKVTGSLSSLMLTVQKEEGTGIFVSQGTPVGK